MIILRFYPNLHVSVRIERNMRKYARRSEGVILSLMEENSKKGQHKLEKYLPYLLIHCMEEGTATEVIDEVAEEEAIETEHGSHKKSLLIVYNDDYNTFDHVIETLMRVCNHTRHQAEQCTHIIHFRGKCCVKEGTYLKLLPMHRGITSVGIQAEIT